MGSSRARQVGIGQTVFVSYPLHGVSEVFVFVLAARHTLLAEARANFLAKIILQAHNLFCSSCFPIENPLPFDDLVI